MGQEILSLISLLKRSLLKKQSLESQMLIINYIKVKNILNKRIIIYE